MSCWTFSTIWWKWLSWGDASWAWAVLELILAVENKDMTVAAVVLMVV